MEQRPIATQKLEVEATAHHIDVAELSDKYSVRKLDKADLEHIYELSARNKIYYKYHPPFVTRESILEDMTALPPGKHSCDKYYVGFFEKEVLIAVMDLISDYPETDCGFIGLFMMDDRFQNKGIGSDIIHYVLKYLKLSKFKKVRFGVDKGNSQSYSFWRKNGFYVISKNDYIVMEELL